MISVATQRFGSVQREASEILNFPGGIFGFELHREWLLLGDREHGALYWMQSVEDADLSLAVVDPREFLPDYALHVSRSSLGTFWNGTEPLVVICVLTEYQQHLCLDLRNPIVINPSRRSGRQVICADGLPRQFALPQQAARLRQTA